MTDFELNEAIAKAFGFETGWRAGNKIGIVDGSATGRYVDYCNNWDDLMPLVQKLFNGYEVVNNKVKAITIDLNRSPAIREFSACSTSQQRALAECVLLVLRSKK